ncbi:GxxExxY protein [Bythopirellula polymerisocia]|uniref:GxxExxY protein n=1 Tax=Bythopirellula polymerisocia TaxID=2528003 RepID=A0A5C6CAI1_9BACT|nr:GxxExxY protein [Bythopirellula polymerisocia]TWU20386.1 hypothetical protein Pla144_49610 [Bythopirellula polymerisocia]
MAEQLIQGELTDTIIKSFFHVYNSLGYGFLEKVYENSSELSLTNASCLVKKQWPVAVSFEGQIVGEYFVDLLVNDAVVVEVKAAKSIASEHEAQLLNYLKATGYSVGLLLNFGPKAEFRRKVFSHQHKTGTE